MKLPGPLIVLSLACALLMPAAAHAQAYPNKPVRIIVPYPPGGATDVIARQIGAKLPALLGQPVVIENKAGASGIIGFDYVAKAPPDGYTLLMGTANMTISAAFGKAPFDPVKDFAPVAQIVSSQNLLCVRPTLAARNIGELIALAKANPGKLNYGSSGIGTPLMTFELLKSLAGIDMVNVPYKGDAPAITDVIGGQIDMYASTVTGLIEHVKNGKLRALGVTGSKRAESLPDVPTIAEAGVSGYALVSWYGILAPGGTPPDVVTKLHTALQNVLAMPDIQKQIVAGGSDPAPGSVEQFASLIRSDVGKYTKLVKDLGLKAD
ncbi:MAG TPA: tripartite tricarboxylate transporter substrate binding protein [Burkholderiaceae bacterium]|nr:tripartite tricarboxylate transporter substrate binding protein [Burkholderiaceae bacterium]